MLRPALLLTLLLSANASACLLENEIAASKAVANTSHQLLLAGDYKGLEELAGRLKRSNEKDERGYPKQVSFYKGLSRWYNPCSRQNVVDPELQQATKLKLDAWVKTYPTSAPARIAMADYEYSLAWHIRGNGYAREVTEDRFVQFRARLAASRKLLESIRKPQRADISWYILMLDLATEQARPVEELVGLLKEGMERFPDAVSIPSAAARYVMPQWHGQEGDINEFIPFAASLAGEHSDTIYAALYRPDHVMKGSMDWPRAKRGMEKLIAAYPAPYNRTAFAQLACKAEDKETFKEQMAHLDGKPVSGVFSSKARFTYCDAQARYINPSCTMNREINDYVCRDTVGVSP